MSFKQKKSLYRSAAVKCLSGKKYNFNVRSKASDTSLSIVTSHSWIATGYGGGGNVVVVPIDYEKYVPKSTPPVIHAHGSPLSDLAFSPFHPDILATGSADGIVKLWSIPQGGLTSDIKKATSEVDVEADIFSMKFNPCADNILAVGSKEGVTIVDLEKGKGNVAPSGKCVSVGWNYDGSLLAATNQDDKTVSIFDPRGDIGGAMQNGISLGSVRKVSYVYFLTNEGNGAGTFGVFSTSSQNKPVLDVFDSRNTKKCIKHMALGNSNGYSLPIYDYDTKVMYMVLRSSPKVSLYDFTHVQTSGPQLQSQYSLKTGAHGIALAPKTICTLNQHEVGRLYTLTPNSIEVYGVKVPRRTARFDPKLWPDTIDTSQATLKSDEWLEGKNQTPNLVDIHTLVSKMNEVCGTGEKKSTTTTTTTSTTSTTTKKYSEKELLEMLKSVTDDDGRWVLDQWEKVGPKAMRASLSTTPDLN